MDSRTGQIVSEKTYAELYAEEQAEYVRLEGSEQAVKRVSDAVKRDRRAQNKRARKARRKARG
jgi:hypothetical protein